MLCTPAPEYAKVCVHQEFCTNCRVCDSLYPPRILYKSEIECLTFEADLLLAQLALLHEVPHRANYVHAVMTFYVIPA